MTEKQSADWKRELERHRQRPHWEDCWRNSDHHDCAIGEISRLTSALDEAVAQERERLAPLVYELVMAGRSAKEIAAAIRGKESVATNTETE